MWGPVLKYGRGQGSLLLTSEPTRTAGMGCALVLPTEFSGRTTAPWPCWSTKAQKPAVWNEPQIFDAKACQIRFETKTWSAINMHNREHTENREHTTHTVGQIAICPLLYHLYIRFYSCHRFSADRKIYFFIDCSVFRLLLTRPSGILHPVRYTALLRLGGNSHDCKLMVFWWYALVTFELSCLKCLKC